MTDALLIHLHKENDTLPIFQKQFAETQKSIDNMLNAIQQGIFTTSTKERLEALEREKSDLSVQIMKEELSRPNLTKEQILFWIYKFRKLNPKRLEHRRRLINSFLNSVYLFDDKIIIDCNYKDGTETIPFEEIENSALGSDLTSLAAPHNDCNFDKKLQSLFFICFQEFSAFSYINESVTEHFRWWLFAFTSLLMKNYAPPFVKDFIPIFLL